MTVEFSYATTTSDEDWAGGVLDNVEVQRGGVRLATQTATREDEVADDVRDVSVAPDGIRYTLSTTGGVFRYDPTTETRERLLKRTNRSVREPCAIAASGNRVFVCDAADGSITALSPRLHRVVGTLTPDLRDPTALGYADGTIYAVADGGLYAVDRTGTATRVSDDAAVDVSVRAGRTYVLGAGENGPSLRTLDAMQAAADESTASDAAAESAIAFEFGRNSFTPTCVTVLDGSPVVAGSFDDRDGHGIFVYDESTGTFDQRVALDGEPAAMVAQSGDPDEQKLYVVTGSGRKCRGFRELREYASHPRENRHVGTAVLRYDSGTNAMDWHRVTLGIVRSSASTQVRVRYVATDEPALVPLEADRFEGMTEATATSIREAGVDSLWAFVQAAPESVLETAADVRREEVVAWQAAAGAELTAQAAAEWTTSDEIDPSDVLLEEASGRYLYVAVELLGTPDASPLVDGVRAYCPRTSYLRHMPELYQDDAQSAAFLERFLSVMESSFVDIQSEIAAMGEHFDPYGASSESLAWLESWLAADLGREWPESARRELLSRAPELYRKRGTKAGLLELIRLYLRHTNPSVDDASRRGRVDASNTGSSVDASPEASGVDVASEYRLFFVERRDLDAVDDAVVERQYGSFLAGKRSFAVFCGSLDSPEQVDAVQAIVDAERPAHVQGSVVALDDEFTLGESSFLGLNSHLTSREFEMGDARLGEDTVLTPRDAAESTPSD